MGGVRGVTEPEQNSCNATLCHLIVPLREGGGLSSSTSSSSSVGNMIGVRTGSVQPKGLLLTHPNSLPVLVLTSN